MDARLKSAMDDIMSLVQTNTGLSLDAEYMPVFQGGTNRVLFGHYHEKPIAFKHYGNSARIQHEERVIQLFAETGYVPKLFPIKNDTVLVMERLAGLPFFMAEETLTLAQWEGLFHQLGTAMAKIVAVAPGGSDLISDQQDLVSGPGFDYRFYCDANMPTFFDTVIERSARVLAEQDVPHKVLLEKSLTDIRDNRDAILSFPSFICMDDFHYSNIIADGSELQGFIDLEMARYGNEILVLAAFLASMHLEQLERWPWFRQGYENGRGRSLESTMISLAAIAAPFTRWVRFMWYWSTDDIPQWVKERNVRASVIQDIKATVELIQTMGLH